MTHSTRSIFSKKLNKSLATKIILDVRDYTYLAMYITVPLSGTISFEASRDILNHWVPLFVKDSSQTGYSSITVDGNYTVLLNYKYVRLTTTQAGGDHGGIEGIMIKSQDIILYGGFDVSTNIVNLVDASANIVNLVDVSANIVNLVDVSANIVNLVDASANITNLVDVSANIVNLLDASANITNLVDVSANIVNLVDVSANIVNRLYLTAPLNFFQKTEYHTILSSNFSFDKELSSKYSQTFIYDDWGTTHNEVGSFVYFNKSTSLFVDAEIIFNSKRSFNLTGKSSILFVKARLPSDSTSGVNSIGLDILYDFAPLTNAFTLQYSSITGHHLSHALGVSNINIPKAEWDDPLDGHGPSKLTVDFTDVLVYIFEIDNISQISKFGVFIGGVMIIAHTVNFNLTQFTTANINMKFVLKMRSNPTSPSDYGELHAVSLHTTSPIVQKICVFKSYYNQVDVLNDTSIVAYVGIRYSQDIMPFTAPTVSVRVISFDFCSFDALKDYVVNIYESPTIAGTDSWASQPDTPVDLFEGTAPNTITNGILRYSGVFSTNGGSIKQAVVIPNGGLYLEVNESLIVAVHTFSSTTGRAAINWIEE